jgi:hypothetical protein
MTSQELAEHTSKVLSKLMTGTGSVTLSPSMFDKIKALNRAETKKAWRRTQFTAKDGADFRIPLSVSSMPYITGFTRSGAVQLTTMEPKHFKLSNKTETGSEKMRGTRLTDFKGAVEHINRISFRNGINLDAMKILNVSREPASRDQIKFLLDRGAILPLSHDTGLYIPDYAMNGNYYSFEYEGRFRNIPPLSDHRSETADKENFEKMVGTPVKNTFSFDVTSLFPYDVSDAPSYHGYVDSTIDARPGRQKGEAVFGTGPMSNVLYAANLTMEAWKARDIVHPTDFIMDRSSGLHISTNMYKKGTTDNRVISAFLNHVGLVFGALGRTAERWKSPGTYLGPERTYSGRNDFRIVDDRLEVRYPGTVLDIGYLGNQMAFVGKLSNDLQLYMKAHGAEPEERYDISSASWSSSEASRAHITTDLHGAGNTPNSRMMKNWFNAFTDAIGITDSFDKALILKFNKACGATKAPREGGI